MVFFIQGGVHIKPPRRWLRQRTDSFERHFIPSAIQVGGGQTSRCFVPGRPPMTQRTPPATNTPGGASSKGTQPIACELKVLQRVWGGDGIFEPVACFR